MRHLTACLVLLYAGSTWAGSISGTVEGVANIAIEETVLGQQVGPVATYQSVPSTLSYVMTTYGPLGDYLKLNPTNSVFSLDTASLRGIPQIDLFEMGPTFDVAVLSSVIYHTYSFRGVFEWTPSQITANYLYEPADFEDTGQIITTTFTSVVPEPSSVVMAVCGVVFDFSVALVRARRESHS
jgi:hypothetical protein